MQYCIYCDRCLGIINSQHPRGALSPRFDVGFPPFAPDQTSPKLAVPGKPWGMTSSVAPKRVATPQLLEPLHLHQNTHVCAASRQKLIHL